MWTPAGEPHPLVFQRIKGGAMAACWPALRPFIEAACNRSAGRFNVQWAAQRLGDHTDQLWAVFDAVTGAPRGIVTTHLNAYPTGLKTLEIVLASGVAIGRANARACFAALQAYRQAQGCDRTEWQGRVGVARWLGLEARALGALVEVTS